MSNYQVTQKTTNVVRCVGQLLYFVPACNLYGDSKSVKVVKINAKSARISSHTKFFDDFFESCSCDVITGFVTRKHVLIGCLFQTKDEYDIQVKINGEFFELGSAINKIMYAPKGVTSAHIAAARKLLKLEKQPE